MNRSFADGMFVFQMSCALLFGGGQFIQMLESGKGVSLSWFVLWELFLVANLIMTLREHRAEPTRLTWQIVTGYWTWIVLVAASLGALVCSGDAAWTWRDTTCMAVAVAGVGTAMLTNYRAGRPIRDPIVTTVMGLCGKTVPQLGLALNIALVGGQGMALSTLVSGHLAVISRLIQIALAIRKSGWRRNTVGSAISELGNELSWIVVTTVWAFA